ncbi:MAG: hypothetical protein Q4E91_00800 [Lachnospiraceae bacterium]|nr:hypothetical protein [Lachnospiraceae bacterium]
MKKIKRILAWAGIVLLLGMYLITFLLGILGNEATKDMLLASIACTIVLPVLLYAMLLLARLLSGSGRKPSDSETQDTEDASHTGA